MKRDNITYEQAKTRVLKQTPYSDMLKKADYVINNNTDVQKLILQGELVLRQLEAL
jgi:dephospho-CoA kinase